MMNIFHFLFFFLFKNVWTFLRAWSTELLLSPLSRVQTDRKRENWRSDASFWYLNETRTRCFSRAAKQNDKTHTKKEDVGREEEEKKNEQDQWRENRQKKMGKEELRNVLPSRSIWDRVRTGNSAGREIYTPLTVWLPSLFYSIVPFSLSVENVSRERPFLSFFSVFHSLFLQRRRLRHSISIAWKRSRNSPSHN